MSPGRAPIVALAAVAAALLLTPAGAQARTPCASERAPPTNANEAQVSAAIFCVTNQVRATYGLPALSREAHLDAAAQAHSQDMGDQNYFSHTSKDGRTPAGRVAAAGYPLSWSGENIAAGHDDARDVMIGWMASKGHCAGILSSARDIGIGTAVVPDSDYGMYYTQDFGNRSPAGFNPAPAAGCPYTINVDDLIDPPGGNGGGAGAAAGGPTLTSLKLSPRTFRAGKRSKVSFKVSEAATVRFRIERGERGRSVNGTCVRPAHSNRNAKHCTRYVRLTGTIVRSGAQGANSFTYRGRLNGKRLAPGRYRLRAVATADTGTSPMKRAGFRIKRP